MNTINTVAGKTPVELEKIGQGIRSMARESGTSLAELTQGYYDLVSAGVDASQAQRVLASSNTLAIGGLATAAEGVDLITTALNSYGVAAKDQGAESERFADIFAKAVERGKVTAAELAASFAQVGPLASNMGIEIEELAAGYAQMTAKGIPAAEAATQMNAAMTAFLRKTGPLKKLEKQTGKNYQAIAGKKGLAAAYEQLGIDAEKAGVPLIELVGRKEALAFALANTGDAMDGYNKNLEAMTNADGTAARQMGERQKGLNFQLDKLKANLIDAGIVIGSKLIPKLVPLAAKFTDLLTSNSGNIDKFGDELANAFDKVMDFATKIPWGTVGAGLKTAAEWSGKLVDAFLRMPAEVQTTIIALAGLNKLSGGAVGGIVSQLGAGLIKGVLGMNAGVVNINAGVVNGGGGLPGGGAAPAGGKAGTVLKALGALTVIGTGIVLTADSIGGFVQENNSNAAKGLTPAETAAVRYYRASAADQAYMAKRLGSIPTRADYQTGLAKLNGYEGNRNADAAASLAAQRKGEQTNDAAQRTTQARIAALTGGTTRGLETVGMKSLRAGEIAAGAIRNKDLSVKVTSVANVNVKTSVTASGIRTASSYAARYAQQGTSQGGNVGGKVVGDPRR